MRKFICILTLLSGLFSCKIQAQTVISSAGAEGASTSVKLSWTIGEPVVETVSGSTRILTQGFHQSRLIVTALDPSTLSGATISVFPNPTEARVTVSVTKGHLQGLRLTLVTAEGKTLFSMTARNATETLDLESCATGIYLLHIQHPGEKGSQTFTIVKH